MEASRGLTRAARQAPEGAVVDSRPPEQVISEVLGGDERVLWTGRPRQGFLLRPADALAIPFSLFWAGFIVFWEMGVSRGKGNLFMELWGIPFVLIGAHMLVGRFFVDKWQRARTTYGLTSQRVIIVSELFRRSIKSLNLRTLADVSLTERPDGSGTDHLRLGGREDGPIGAFSFPA